MLEVKVKVKDTFRQGITKEDLGSQLKTLTVLSAFNAKFPTVHCRYKTFNIKYISLSSI